MGRRVAPVRDISWTVSAYRRGATKRGVRIASAGFSIDTTEVTRAQYQAWLDTNPSPDGQGPECAWNASFDPEDSLDWTGSPCMEWGPPWGPGWAPSIPELIYEGPGAEHHPVVCVDFCDAKAYCKALGKHLCGRLGGNGDAWVEMLDKDEIPSPLESEWYQACSWSSL